MRPDFHINVLVVFRKARTLYQFDQYVNNFNMNMDEYLDFANIITPKQFLEKIAGIDVEKL